MNSWCPLPLFLLSLAPPPAAPPVVKGLTVTRDPDNKQVQSRWEPVETAPPVGVVVLYQIQYRDSKGSIMTVFRSSKFTSVVLNNVIDANSYEVRDVAVM